MNNVKADIDNFYILLEDMTEDKMMYYCMKYPDDIYVDMVKTLYNLKLQYPSLLLHPLEFLNKPAIYSVKNKTIQNNYSIYKNAFLYHGQYSYQNKIVFGLRSEGSGHYDFFVINVANEVELHFLDQNDAQKYIKTMTND